MENASARAMVSVGEAELLGRGARSLRGCFGGVAEDRLSLLPPQASDRRYMRWQHAEGSEIAMLLPAQGGGAEEVGSVQASRVSEESFVQVGRWLASLGVAVPVVRAIDEANRVIWVEDLGDEDFLSRVERDSGTRRACYEEAIGLLLQLREATMEAEVPALVGERRFDAELLRWECAHYVEWRLEEGLGLRIGAGDRETLDAGFDQLVDALAEIPEAVVHRDVQSRNLMFDGAGRLRLIDFQDALMGPLVYDAVALLRDSYHVLPQEEFELLLDTWAEGMSARGLAAGAGPDALRRWFHLQTVQRKLKDAGRFVFLARRKGNPSFLPFIEDTLAYVVLALRHLPELAGLQACLTRLDPQL